MLARSGSVLIGRRVFLLQSILSLCGVGRSTVAVAAFANIPRNDHRRKVSSAGSSETVEPKVSSDWMSVLPYEDGSHGSAKIVIPVDAGDDKFDQDSFLPRLEATIASCRQLQKSSLWVEVPMLRGSLLEGLYKTGLRFHHVNGDVASLCLWLKDTPSKIPEYATHQMVRYAVNQSCRRESHLLLQGSRGHGCE